MNHYRINVSNLIDNFGAEKKIETNFKFATLQKSDLKIFFSEPVELDLVVKNVGEDLLVEGSIKTELTLNCDRCLKEFTYSSTIDLKELFLRVKKRDEELSGEEIFPVEGVEIDLGPAIDQALLLALPMQLLCKVDCKGLCSKCGQDLNVKICNCKKNEIDERLIPLKKLLED